jgi:hypothetical protein
MKGDEGMKSQARWNKIYQKKLRKQQEREQQAMLGKRTFKKENDKNGRN